MAGRIVVWYADENGDNLLPAEEETENPDDNIIVDFSVLCPPRYGKNPL